MTQFINLTPHAITVVGLGTIEPSGTVARVAAVREELPNTMGVRLTRQAFGKVTGLPAPQPDTVFIVSAMVLSALGENSYGCVAPDTGADAVRNEQGHIVAVRGFVCN